MHQRRRTRWWSLAGLGICLMAAVLSGCSAAKAPGQSNQTSSAPQSSARNAAEALAPAAERAGAPSAPAAVTGAAPAAGAPSGDPATQAQSNAPFDRLIIYNANLRVAVEDVSKAVSELTRIAGETCSANTCGFVSESNLHYENDRQVGTLTIQVPSDHYGDALNRVRGLGQVLNETSKSQDVTEQFTDLQSELRNLKATESRYLDLLKDAKSIQDILTLEDRLRTVRAQIERDQGRINYLQHRADLATITVDVTPPVAGPATPLPRPLAAAQQAWAASLEFLSTGASIVVTVVVFFWWLAPFVLAGLIALRIWWLRRHPRAPLMTPGG